MQSRQRSSRGWEGIERRQVTRPWISQPGCGCIVVGDRTCGGIGFSWFSFFNPAWSRRIAPRCRSVVSCSSCIVTPKACTTPHRDPHKSFAGELGTRPSPGVNVLACRKPFWQTPRGCQRRNDAVTRPTAPVGSCAAAKGGWSEQPWTDWRSKTRKPRNLPVARLRMTKPLRENMVSFRAGQNANPVLHVDIRDITPVSEETGRWSRMDSNPFARSISL